MSKWAAALMTTLALSAGLTATLSAARQGRRHGGPLGRIASRRLGLTDAQRQQLKGIAQAHRDEMTSVRQRLLAARTALGNVTAATPLDESLVKQRSADLSTAQADRTALRARVRAEMLEVLTPDQQAQLKALQDGSRNRKRRRP